MGVAEWFKTFNEALVVKNQASIASRCKRITKRLNMDFWNSESDVSHRFYVGSFGRNTAVDPFSDLDIIFQLPASVFERYSAYRSNGQSALLQTVKLSITKTYANTRIRADGQVIQVLFSDNLVFEVVPAFKKTSGAFLFPNAMDGGRWQTTNPLPEIKAIQVRDRACNRNLIRLCRMARAWKVKHNVPIGGLLIDTLAYQFIEHYSFRNHSFFYYDLMVRDFFDWMSQQDRAQEYWKAPGSGQYVYGKDLFQAKARTGYKLACKAIEHEWASPKREPSAKLMWREIFGPKYPF